MLRAVLNSGNSLLAMGEDGRVDGLPLALARFIAAETGVLLDVRLVAGTAAVIQALTSDAADIGFLAIDPARTAQLAFTRPFVQMEATCLVRAGSATSCAELDRAGAVVAVLAGSGPALLFQRLATRAALKQLASLQACMDALRSGTVDAVAGLRHSLTGLAAGDAGVTVLRDAFGQVGQSICVASARSDRIEQLDGLIARFPRAPAG